MDKTNRTILDLLRANARMSWQQIGQQVHLTGQAVSARVRQMEELGIIGGYTVRQLHLSRHHITVFMHSPQFEAFERFLAHEEQVESATKVSGEGCYQLIFAATEASALDPFLTRLLHYGTYRVHSVVRQVK